MISILHPSRGRPEKSFNTFKKWNEMAATPIEFILSIDEDEPTNTFTGASQYITLYNSVQYSYQVISNHNKSAVDAINAAARVAKGDVFIVVSDDTEPFKDWDVALYREIKGKTDFILKTQDGVQPWILTNPILDWHYYNRFGYIYHPDYRHMFCDTELTCVADLTGRKITSNILFKHNHYSVTKEPPDAISKRADSTWDQGEKLFLERYKRNFDLPPDQIKGKIEDNGMINWLKRKVRR